MKTSQTFAVTILGIGLSLSFNNCVQPSKAASIEQEVAPRAKRMGRSRLETPVRHTCSNRLAQTIGTSASEAGELKVVVYSLSAPPQKGVQEFCEIHGPQVRSKLLRDKTLEIDLAKCPDLTPGDYFAAVVGEEAPVESGKALRSLILESVPLTITTPKTGHLQNVIGGRLAVRVAAEAPPALLYGASTGASEDCDTNIRRVSLRMDAI